MNHTLTHIHPSLFIRFLADSSNNSAPTTEVSSIPVPVTFTSEPVTKSIKNENLQNVSLIPFKKYKSTRERLKYQRQNKDKASSSSNTNIVAKEKRKAAKVPPIPASLKKKQKIDLQSDISPLI